MRLPKNAPVSCASTKPGTDESEIPAKLSVNDLPSVIAGFAKLVDEVKK